MQSSPTKGLGSYTEIITETGLSLLLVLVFFLMFLGLLVWLFPIGGQLTGNITGDRSLGSQQSARSLDGKELDALTTEPFAAKLTQIQNTVKSKRASAIAWSNARSGMALYDRDAVQTARKATALVAFDDKNYLRVSENSLVVIKRLQQDKLLNEKQSFVVMVDGELQGSVAETDKKAVYVEVATPGAVARIASGNAAEGQAEFKIKVNADKSSTIAVYSGVAEVVAEGKVVQIGENQTTTVKLGETPQPAQNMLDAPELSSPKTNAIYYYRDLPPKVNFSWGASNNAKAYHFLVARDAGFRDLVVDERLSRPYFTHGNLKDGEYYWRTKIFHPQREGAYTEPRRVFMEQNQKAPVLSVKFPPISVTRSRQRLTGTVRPKSRIFVMGKEVVVDRFGEFSHSLRLKQGLNVVVVEAVDSAGNVAYRSRLVNGKF